MTIQSSLRGYTERDVSNLLGFSVRQIRSFAADGLFEGVEESDGLLSFEDVVVLRTAKGLVQERFSAQKVRATLRRLRRQLPTDRPLSAVRLSVEAGSIVVHDGCASWEPDSGQVVFDFDVMDAWKEETAAVLETEEVGPGAEEWYARACELEEQSPQEAQAAYREALELDCEHVDANLNLGRLLHEARNLKGAEHYYRRALKNRPLDVTAAYNLGVVLEDLGLLKEAIAAYEQAIEGDPGHEDAYHNAARLYERRGDKASAVRLLKGLRALGR